MVYGHISSLLNENMGRYGENIICQNDMEETAMNMNLTDVSCGQPIIIPLPCEAKSLGDTILREVNKENFSDADVCTSLFTIATGIKSFKKFSAQYGLIDLDLTWPTRDKMIFTLSERGKHGEYIQKKSATTHSFKFIADSTQIGECVLKMMES